MLIGFDGFDRGPRVSIGFDGFDRGPRMLIGFDGFDGFDRGSEKSQT